MSVLSAQSIRRMALKHEMIRPFRERHGDHTRLSGGLSPAAYDCHTANRVVLKPRQSALAVTVERFIMPYNIQAEIKDKSSWARNFVSAYNTVMDPGFRGWLTIELTNNTDGTIIFEEGDPVCKLVFYWLDDDTEMPYVGKYQDQPPEPVGPR